MTRNPHDPTDNDGGYRRWIDHGEQHGDWGAWHGTTMVPGKKWDWSSQPSTFKGPSNSYSPIRGSTPPTSTAGSGFGFLLFVAVALVIRYRDESFIAVAGILATAAMCKTSSVCSDRQTVPVIVAACGLSMTAALEYLYHVSTMSSGVIVDSLLDSMAVFTQRPIISNHMDLLVIACIGIIVAVGAFFFAHSVEDLIVQPIAVLLLTAMAIGGVVGYQTLSAFYQTFSASGATTESRKAVVSTTVRPGNSESETFKYVDACCNLTAKDVPMSSSGLGGKK
jgi:hypothetical protein